jgi:hypothetical protein
MDDFCDDGEARRDISVHGFLQHSAQQPHGGQYRESGLDVALASRQPPPATDRDRPLDHGPQHMESLWVRIALTPALGRAWRDHDGPYRIRDWVLGPIRFAPGANQGPMLGIFFTKPGGVVLGGLNSRQTKRTEAFFG